MSRLANLTDDEMTPLQRELADGVLNGARGTFAGPFPIWLRSPGAFRGAEALGTHLRFDASLPKPLKEFAVLLAARHWRCEYEWEAHVRHALASGLDAEFIAAIGRGERPVGVDGTFAATHDFMTALLQQGRVPDAEYAAAQAMLASEQLVELVMLAGYYTLIAMTLNTFGVVALQPAKYPLRP